MDLLSQIRDGVARNPAVAGKADAFGQPFNVDIPITILKETAIVRTGGIIDAGHSAPRLVTVFVKQEPRMSPPDTPPSP